MTLGRVFRTGFLRSAEKCFKRNLKLCVREVVRLEEGAQVHVKLDKRSLAIW